MRERLEPRPNSGSDAQPWPGRKPGPYAWYEIQDSVDYYALFEKPKIFWPDIGKFPRFSWDISGTYVNDKGYTERDAISALALAITDLARTRYNLHRQTHHRIRTDLGTPGARLNQKLTAWWELDFSAFRREVKTAFKQEIPIKERADWEQWLADQHAEHERLTTEIIRLESALNDRVYALFNLSPAEVKLIEEHTKYQYGEV